MNFPITWEKFKKRANIRNACRPIHIMYLVDFIIKNIFRSSVMLITISWISSIFLPEIQCLQPLNWFSSTVYWRTSPESEKIIKRMISYKLTSKHFNTLLISMYYMYHIYLSETLKIHSIIPLNLINICH